MNTGTRTFSALLAGAMLFSLSACGGAPDTADGDGSTPASAADAVPQGRWVEQEATGIPADVYLPRAPAALADGSLVLYAQQGRDGENPHTAKLTSTDGGATWQCETPAWAAEVGEVVQWDVRPDGTAVLTTVDGGSWRIDPDGTVTQLDLLEAAAGAMRISQLCFLADGTLAVLPTMGPSTEGESAPGSFFFYDLDAKAVKTWVQTAGGGTTGGFSAAGSSDDGSTVYYGSTDVASLVPGQDADGTAFAYYMTMEGDLCRAGLDGSTATVQSALYTSALTVDADGAICYADKTGLYRQVPDGGLTEQLVDGSGMTFSLQSWYLSSMSCAPDGSFLMLLTDTSVGACKLCRYTFDESLSAPTETLEIWSLQENATVRAAIQAFTKEHPECAVEYEPVMSNDSGMTEDDALRALNTELLAGEGPDVLILDGADAEAFVDSGLLADLSGTVEPDALYGFVVDGYTREDGTLPLVPARFTVPLMHGPAEELDGVATLDDVAALVQRHPARPVGDDWTPLEESQRYALAFDSVDTLVKFALQTSQPALLTDTSLDEAALNDLLAFVQAVGDHYGMGSWDAPAAAIGSMGNFGGADAISWDGGMAEYGMADRAVCGFGSMSSPSWLGAEILCGEDGDKTILQPGLSTGVWTPACLTAISAGSDQPELAQAFVAALLSDEVQGSYQNDGMPVTLAGMQASLDRNLEEMQEHGYTGGLDELLAQLTTPVVVDDALYKSLVTHSKAMLTGSETADQAAAGVQADLALRFAERQ